MEFRRLGRSGLLVSDICFGTMTFGSQVDEAASLRLLDMAYDGGVNFYDTAEMYFWLRGEHDKFHVIGGQGWPGHAKDRPAPYGVPEGIKR